MIVRTEQELAALQRIGRICALALAEMKAAVRPGLTTAALDAVGAAVLARYGARSAPQLIYRFPGATCISLNSEAAHGIPGPRVIQPGDLVNIDVSAELDGYFADCAWTVAVPPVPPIKQRLADCARAALWEGIAHARAGRRVNAIGRATEGVARRCGFSIIRSLPGHGVGRSLHEEPTVPAFFTPQASARLREGMVLTVEPFLTTGAESIVEGPDGWTLSTPDGSLSAQYEHTILITRGQPQVITTAG